jgi:hypothetical protein
MKTIDGDILDVQSGIICHQVNCKRVANAGLAKQIRNKYPEWYKDFMQVYAPYLGGVRLFPVRAGLWIASLYAQTQYGHVGRFTNYVAMRTCLTKLANNIPDPNLNVYIPYGIGCGLGGGDWHIVYRIIENNIPDAILIRSTK